MMQTQMPSRVVPRLRLPWLTIVIVVHALYAQVAGQQDLFDEGVFGGASPLSQGKPPVTVSAEFTVDAAGGKGQLAVTAEIAQEHHIYSLTQEPKGPVPSKIELDPSDDFQLLANFEPTPTPTTRIGTQAFPGVKVEEHEGMVTWTVPIELASGVAAEKIGRKNFAPGHSEVR